MNDALAPRDRDYFIPSKWKKAHFTICGVVRVRGVIDAWVFIGHRCEVTRAALIFIKRRLAPMLHVLDLGIAWAFDLPASRYGGRRWLNQRRARKKLRRLARVNAEACKRAPWKNYGIRAFLDDFNFMRRERVTHKTLRRKWLRCKRNGLGWRAKARRAGLVTVRAHNIKADYIPRFQQQDKVSSK